MQQHALVVPVKLMLSPRFVTGGGGSSAAMARNPSSTLPPLRAGENGIKAVLFRGDNARRCMALEPC